MNKKKFFVANSNSKQINHFGIEILYESLSLLNPNLKIILDDNIKKILIESD